MTNPLPATSTTHKRELTVLPAPVVRYTLPHEYDDPELDGQTFEYDLSEYPPGYLAYLRAIHGCKNNEEVAALLSMWTESPSALPEVIDLTETDRHIFAEEEVKLNLPKPVAKEYVGFSESCYVLLYKRGQEDASDYISRIFGWCAANLKGPYSMWSEVNRSMDDLDIYLEFYDTSDHEAFMAKYPS